MGSLPFKTSPTYRIFSEPLDPDDNTAVANAYDDMRDILDAADIEHLMATLLEGNRLVVYFSKEDLDRALAVIGAKPSSESAPTQLRIVPSERHYKSLHYIPNFQDPKSRIAAKELVLDAITASQIKDYEIIEDNRHLEVYFKYKHDKRHFDLFMKPEEEDLTTTTFIFNQKTLDRAPQLYEQIQLAIGQSEINPKHALAFLSDGNVTLAAVSTEVYFKVWESISPQGIKLISP